MVKINKYDFVIAIDPGASGGIAKATHLGGSEWDIDLEPMPKSITTIVEIFDPFVCTNTLVVVEEVPKFVAGMQTSATAMATLHQNFGYLLGVIDAMGLKLITVRPQEWQKTVGAGAKKNYGNKWKAHLKDLAVRRFPEIKKGITLKTADALLILSTYL